MVEAQAVPQESISPWLLAVFAKLSRSPRIALVGCRTGTRKVASAGSLSPSGIAIDRHAGQGVDSNFITDFEVALGRARATESAAYVDSFDPRERYD